MPGISPSSLKFVFHLAPVCPIWSMKINTFYTRTTKTSLENELSVTLRRLKALSTKQVFFCNVPEKKRNQESKSEPQLHSDTATYCGGASKLVLMFSLRIHPLICPSVFFNSYTLIEESCSGFVLPKFIEVNPPHPT